MNTINEIRKIVFVAVVMAICGIVAGDDRPRNFFQRERVTTKSSASLSPVSAILAQAKSEKPEKSEKPKYTRSIERPRNFFQRERAQIELPEPKIEPPTPTPTTIVPAITPDPDPISVPESIVPPRQTPELYSVRYRPSILGAISRSIEMRYDVPRELFDAEPEPTVWLDGYTFKGCVHCPAAKDRFESQYRGMKVRWHEVDPEPNQDYPFIADHQSNLQWSGKIIQDWPTLYERVNKRRSERGLPLATSSTDDSPVRLCSISRDLFSVGLEAGNTEGVELLNQSCDFTDKSWSISVPANLFVKWNTKAGNVRFEFPKNRATIKTASVWNPLEFSKPIKAMEFHQKSRRIYLETSWWRKFYIDVKD